MGARPGVLSEKRIASGTGPVATMLAHGRGLGLVLVALLAVAHALWSEGPGERLRRTLFDACQLLFPRQAETSPAVIVAIDEASLARLGQWPWPRSRLADLVGRIATAGPAAIGIDLLMPEPDRASPEVWRLDLKDPSETLLRELATRPAHDALLAESLRGVPVVLGVAGMPEGRPGPGGTLAPVRSRGGDPLPFLIGYPSALRSLPILDGAAAGHGLLSADVDPDGIVRQVPLLAGLGGQPAPGLGLEMIRLAAGVPGFDVLVDDGGLVAVAAGPLAVASEPDGRVWLHFGPHEPARFVSAADVLAGGVTPDMLEDRLVLIGVTGLGLIDYPTTPLGERIPGIEVHAQLLESLVDGTLLQRPRWAPTLETGLLVLTGLLMVILVPRLRPSLAWVPPVAAAAVLAGGGLAAFVQGHWLVDVAGPMAGGGLVFVAMLGTTLVEADRRRKALAAALERERLAAAHMAGELAAARRIQMSILPAPETVTGDPRIDLAAFIEPARDVGGDLYDIFLLDEHTLFVAVGDVSGKGIPASLFMAVGKSLLKSVVLRHGEASDRLATIDTVATTANAEISRDNSEMLFITLCAALIDLRTGDMAWCNAGHDAPYSLRAGRKPERLDSVGGPPLCMLPDFPYPAEHHRLVPGEVIVLTTDGVSEAQNAAKDLYGHERLEAALIRAADTDASAAGCLQVLKADVAAFVAGADPADDLTILAVRWRGGDVRA